MTDEYHTCLRVLYLKISPLWEMTGSENSHELGVFS